jgi:hypothetical protein
MRHPPDKERSRPPGRKGGPDTNTATNGPTIIDDRADPRRVGELLGDWLAIRMGEVDDLVAEARERVDALPDQRVLWSLFGELLLQVRCLEREVAELKKAIRR